MTEIIWPYPFLLTGFGLCAKVTGVVTRQEDIQREQMGEYLKRLIDALPYPPTDEEHDRLFRQALKHVNRLAKLRGWEPFSHRPGLWVRCHVCEKLFLAHQGGAKYHPACRNREKTPADRIPKKLRATHRRLKTAKQLRRTRSAKAR